MTATSDRQRVVVAMSGGVDSSAAAALLLEQGYEVLGITLRVWSYEGPARCGSCCSPDDVDDARAVAGKLGIPFYVANSEELFSKQVVQPFVREYLSGRTPIPCVACNRDVKFGFLLARARALGARLATGHYARVVEEGGRRRVHCAVDDAKDQTYFLFNLSQDDLQDVLFPVGGMTKAEVREVARRHGLPTASKAESQEICFVPDGKYANFIEKVAGPQPQGDIADEAGTVLGRHAGVHRYTVGQRSGLGITTAVPHYVQRIDAAANRVVVGPKEGLFSTRFRVPAVSWISGEPPVEPLEVEVKVRHRSTRLKATVRASGAGAEVELQDAARAVTPGQAAVFYRGQELLGGGFIG
ncbi:MAG: tRNA 2-thiouridine(34) synthase MnmA [Myxococcales bacterium]